MNKATKYYLNKLKHQSTDLILIDYDNQRVVKIIQSGYTPFDREIRDYLIRFYNSNLKLDFFSEYDVNYNLDIIIHQMFSYNLLQSVIPSKVLYSNTQKILNDFTNNNTSSLYLLKKHNKNIKNIEIFTENTKSLDFFLYKNKFYLLNLDKFYFKMYDKNGNLIHRNQLNQEDQYYIQKYNNQEYCYIIL